MAHAPANNLHHKDAITYQHRVAGVGGILTQLPVLAANHHLPVHLLLAAPPPLEAHLQAPALQATIG
ncbi:hypothetical protein HYS92_01715 [Candidatus Daviesbacteria bacterium]|nr:hypothetical protein [Candidatus Daviesbacteria bacterium]